MTNRNGNWMETFTGIKFYPLDAKPEEIKIEDIAHALSNLCRFGGHCKRFYSVAQHSVLVCSLANEYKLEALLHDATEAYLIDLPRPIKQSIPEYQEIEKRLSHVIAERFKLAYPYPAKIHEYDDIALEIEHQALLSNKVMWSFEGGTPITPKNIVIEIMNPVEAERSFLNHYYRLVEFGMGVKYGGKEKVH